jgi:hypothetical protein
MRALPVVAAIVLAAAGDARGAEWTPPAWAAADTLELRTDVPGEGPYWFKVWLVTLDDQLYVRLGTRAASRIERSRTRPLVGVRVGGAEFDRVRGVPAPEMAERVAAAMGEKYTSDLLVRFFPHPLTLRLVPEPAAAP